MRTLLGIALVCVAACATALLSAQPPAAPAVTLQELPPPRPIASAPLEPGERPLPINLPTALKLANANPLDIQIAAARIRIAAAQLNQANVLWLPTIFTGGDYYRHDGKVQTVQGDIISTSKSALMVGTGPFAVFAVTDAVFSPLAARQTLRARQAALQATTNDTMLAVAESYFNVQQARGELAGAIDTVRRAEDLTRRTEELSKGLVPPLEAARARTELARRRQAAVSARERWQVASADLTRLLRLDRTAVVQPMEPPHLRVTLVAPNQPAEDLIALALMNRPELAGQQALVQATLQQLRQEKLRPFLPNVLVRGGATNPAGSPTSAMGVGYFGGGINGSLSNFSARSDFDVQLVWELQNLGLGNRARIRARRSENDIAQLQLLQVQDRVMAEVVQALAQARSAAKRMGQAEDELKEALDSAQKNFEGLGQTKRLGGNLVLLVIRPQEVVAAVQALSQAYVDYFGAVGDYGRSQFRLYRALGHPAQHLGSQVPQDCVPSIAPPSSRATFGQPIPIHGR